MTVKDITDAEFDTSIQSDTLTLVDFWAPWCGPCKNLAPIFEEASQELSDTASFLKINIDDHQEAAGKLGVRSIPMLALFKNGEMVSSKSGMLSKNDLTEWVRSFK